MDDAALLFQRLYKLQLVVVLQRRIWDGYDLAADLEGVENGSGACSGFHNITNENCVSRQHRLSVPRRKIPTAMTDNYALQGLPRPRKGVSHVRRYVVRVLE